MADDWEDWEDESFTPAPVVSATNGQYETLGQAVLAKVNEPDESKFAGEDEEEEQPSWETHVPKPQKPKEVKKKYEDKGKVAAELDVPLDDPVAEKLRQQRLIEQADYEATKELFGNDLDLEKFIPKSAKDFEDYAKLLCFKYLTPHAKSPHYKLLLKQIIKHGLAPSSTQDVKDVETAIAGIRSQKLKEEKEAKAAAEKAKKKKSINVGKSGGSAGLDDYKYDDALDDEVDFM